MLQVLFTNNAQLCRSVCCFSLYKVCHRTLCPRQSLIKGSLTSLSVKIAHKEKAFHCKQETQLSTNCAKMTILMIAYVC